jgi:hypothetical protein
MPASASHCDSVSSLSISIERCCMTLAISTYSSRKYLPYKRVAV